MSRKFTVYVAGPEAGVARLRRLRTAILITASVTYVLLATKGGTSSSSSIPQVEEPDDLATHYQVNTQSAALLTETADAGEAYLNDTLFLGDSNTVRLYNNADHPAAVLRQRGHRHPDRAVRTAGHLPRHRPALPPWPRLWP